MDHMGGLRRASYGPYGCERRGKKVDNSGTGTNFPKYYGKLVPVPSYPYSCTLSASLRLTRLMERVCSAATAR